MTFYAGDRFPNWKGSLFVWALRTGGIRNTGHLERLVFNEQGEEKWREWLLGEPASIGSAMCGRARMGSSTS